MLKGVRVLKNSPPAQRALMLLDHDPQTFWQALQFYLRQSEPGDLATALRASLTSLDSENRSQLALFIAGPDAGSQQQSSPAVLNAEIDRVSTLPQFKASVESFLRANPRAVAQLSSRLLQELLAMAENPQIVSQRLDGSGLFFAENEGAGSGGKRRAGFSAPGWLLPLGAFFIGSIITAFVISWLFGRMNPVTRTEAVVPPVYLVTAKPLKSSPRRGAPTNVYVVPAQTLGQPFGNAQPPATGPTLGDFTGSQSPNFNRGDRSPQRGAKGPSPIGAAKAGGPPGGRPVSAGRSGAVSNGPTPVPNASETPLAVEPETRTFVAVPQPSPAAAASMDPSGLILTGPTPESVLSPVPPTASPAPSAAPSPKATHKRIRLGYHCAKCH